MKKYFSKILIGLFSLVFFASCQKDETKITYAGGTTAPVLSTSVANNDSIVLSPSDSSAAAIALSWTNPNYQFSNGVSSLNVNYTVQIDTVGSNFTNPNMVQVSVTSDLSTSFTVGDLNSKLFGGLFLKTGVPHHIAMRLVSYLNQGSLPLYSNILTYTITPYAIPPAVTPPSSGTLFIVGSATGGGWNNPITVDPATQQFTQISPTDYKITISLTGGGEYKFIAVNGSWTDQWSVKDGDTFPNGGPFVYSGNNCIAPAANGTYTIEVNFQTGLFSVK